MNIILAEELAAGGQSTEKSFDKPVIQIGRDPFDSDIAYDNSTYPMVSRKHAELRWTDGKWFIVDLNSSYGTYVNGQRIGAPQQLVVGQRLQFGESGPVMKVVWFEVLSDSVKSYSPPAIKDPFAAKPPVPSFIKM